MHCTADEEREEAHMEQQSMEGQRAIVTGGGGGIGKAACAQLAARGARVAVFDVDRAKAQETAASLAAAGSESMACPVDISDRAQVAGAVGCVLDAYGGIDLLVNCAGLYRIGTIGDISEEDWDHMLGVNLKGPFLLCQAVVPIMQRQGRGAIVNVSSISGRTTSMLAGVHYVASKAGIIGLTMCLANQLAAGGIRVNCVAPGSVDTPMLDFLEPEQKGRLAGRVPMGRLARPEEVAAAIVFLASPEASYITGETLNVNGGSFMV
jgi:NAD(P)-dependent dehydrogenase (short-subunit alcohol dehydrogenase family)